MNTANYRQVKRLEALGFDDTLEMRDRVYLGCSRCNAVSINGVPCHESGCPNERRERECKECGGDFIEETRGQEFCEDACYRHYWGLACDCEACAEFEAEFLEETEEI